MNFGWWYTNTTGSVLAIILRTSAKREHVMKEKNTGNEVGGIPGQLKWGLEMIIVTKQLLDVILQEIMGMVRYMCLAAAKYKHLGDDAVNIATM
jgi:hypothetical protein